MIQFGVRQLVDAIEEGSGYTSWFQKTSGPQTFGARWGDLSMGTGTPRYNSYVGTPLAATPLTNSGNTGIYLGPEPPAGKSRYIHRMGLCSNSITLHPATFVLLDYLMFYPLIDGDEAEVQLLDNTQTLPRSTTGEGVVLMPVATAPMAADGACTVTYTNEQGVSGRTMTFSILFGDRAGVLLAGAPDSLLAARAQGWFIGPQNGDRGIRSIDSVQFTSPVSGFMSFVLVKPVLAINAYESGTWHEREFVREQMSMPKVDSGAYLNMIYKAGQGGTTIPLLGAIDFVWR